jgi:hypothetical protein
MAEGLRRKDASAKFFASLRLCAFALSSSLPLSVKVSSNTSELQVVQTDLAIRDAGVRALPRDSVIDFNTRIGFY